jgi:ABC-type glycerol-3-phosphate transport system substrate-binding protein
MVRGYVVGSRRESISDVGWYPDLYLATQLDFWDAIASGSGHISVFKDGPHPNAAQLYVNWFLSRDGQLNWQKHTGRNSFRIDLPKDMLEFLELQVPKEGGKYMLTSLAKYDDIEPVRKLVGELFGDGKRR